MLEGKRTYIAIGAMVLGMIAQKYKLTFTTEELSSWLNLGWDFCATAAAFYYRSKVKCEPTTVQTGG